MKNNVKQLLYLSLALFLAFPVLAQDKTESQLEQEKLGNEIYSLSQQEEKLGNEIYSFLQQDRYDDLKNILLKVDPQLKDNISSLVVKRIWKGFTGKSSPGALAIEAFYYDLQWHLANGFTYDEAAEKNYTSIPFIRYALYRPFNDITLDYLFLLEWRVPHMVELYEVLKKHNAVDLAVSYRTTVFHDLFTMKDFSEEYSSDQYGAMLVRLFGEKEWYWLWKYLILPGVDMPAESLKEMQDSIAEFFPKVCKNPNYIHELLDHELSQYRWYDTDYNAQEECKGFIIKAKEYGLWSDKAQKEYDRLSWKGFKNLKKNFKDTLHRIRHYDGNLDDIESAN